MKKLLLLYLRPRPLPSLQPLRRPRRMPVVTAVALEPVLSAGSLLARSSAAPLRMLERRPMWWRRRRAMSSIPAMLRRFPARTATGRACRSMMPTAT